MSVRKRVWLNTPYHNYSDKKKYSLSTEEITNYKLYEESNTHFNYGDFVNATCVSKTSVEIFSKLPNYMILYNGDVIESRWYVLSYTFLSGEPTDTYGTYNVTLVRDVVVDFKNIIKSNEFKCKRGQLPRTSFSPVLVQPEGMTLNKIKKSQIPIRSWDKDNKWLTIFYDCNATEEQRTISFDYSGQFQSDYPIEDLQGEYLEKGFSLSSSEQSTTNIYKRRWDKYTQVYRFDIVFGGGSSYSVFYEVGCTKNASSVIIGQTIYRNLYYKYIGNSGADDHTLNYSKSTIESMLSSLHADDIMSLLNSNFNINKEDNYSDIRNKYDQKLILNDEVVNRMIISEEDKASVIIDNLDPYKTQLTSLIRSGLPWSDVVSATPVLPAPTPSVTIVGSLETTTSEFTSTLQTISSQGRIILPENSKLDEVDVGCVTIPFGVNTEIIDTSCLYKLDESNIKSIFTTGWTLSGSVIYDIQILPYCPSSILNGLHLSKDPSNDIDISDVSVEDKIPITLIDGISPIYYCINCKTSSMDYRYNIDLSDYQSTDIKLDSMTKSMRLCSQDHKSSFEFNPTLNNGVEALSISYTLRPLTTIFRICPVFKNEGLYGNNYQDSRGLIWQGGFSLAQVSDKWVEYKLQNSTYNSIFNREVTNLEISQENARALETIAYQNNAANAQTQINAQGAKAGLSLLAGIGGAIAGAATGNPMALLGGAGAIMGAANAGIGIGAAREVADRNLQDAKRAQTINDSSRAENLAYKQDIFNLQMQSIQSKPNTLTSNTDYSIINYYKAYIEFYDCSDEEKEFIDKYLTYHGMKIGQIGYIFKYLDGSMSYIEGVLLFTTGLTPPVGNAINSELTGGIYVQEGLFE